MTCLGFGQYTLQQSEIMKSFPPTELKIGKKFHRATRRHPLLIHTRGILIYFLLTHSAMNRQALKGRKTHADSSGWKDIQMSVVEMRHIIQSMIWCNIITLLFLEFLYATTGEHRLQMSSGFRSSSCGSAGCDARHVNALWRSYKFRLFLSARYI